MKKLEFENKSSTSSTLLYHGSNCVVELPALDKCKSDNDFGAAFYLTADKKKAESWSLLKADKEGTGKSVVTVYESDFTNLVVKDVGKFSTEAWVAVLLKNRGYSGYITRRQAFKFIDKYYPDIDDADVVIGYRADDSYFRIIEAFLSNSIGIGNISSLLRVGRLGYQIALKSPKAFNQMFIRYNKYYTNMSLSLQASKKADSEARIKCVRWIEDIQDGVLPLIGKTFKELL